MGSNGKEPIKDTGVSRRNGSKGEGNIRMHIVPMGCTTRSIPLNRFAVQKGKTPFEVLFDREYKGTLAPWGSVVLAKQMPKVKEKGEAWRKGTFVGKDMVSNMNLVSTRQGVVKCRTMRQCSTFDAETMAQVSGTPWDYGQQHLMTKTRQNKRLPPTSGLEAIPEGRPLPKTPQGGNDEGGEYAPSDGPGPDEAGSDPTSSESRGDDDDDDNEDPGGGQRGTTRRRSERSSSSEQMIPGEDPPASPTKRSLEDRAEEPEPVRQRIDEGTGEVEERLDKFQAVRVKDVRSVNEIKKFLRSEQPRYHIDEEVELDEFEDLETAVGSDKEDVDYVPDGEDEIAEEVPKWSHAVEDGPPKLEEVELEQVDGVSRQSEIERLTKMGVLKEMPEGTDVTKYKFLSTKVVYDWRHREGEWRRRGRLVAREFRWLSSYDIASLFSPTGVASTVKLLSGLFVSSDGYTLGSIDVGDAYLMMEQEEPTVVEVDGKYYELGFTLPGQRIGSSAWFNKLKGYLEEFGLTSDDGLRALFYKRPEEGQKE